MKIINEDIFVDWNKKIQLEMTLKELQNIYDALGIFSYPKAQEVWKERQEAEGTVLCIPYDHTHNFELYDTIEDVLQRLGGISNQWQVYTKLMKD